MRKTILITGASSGIGEATAKYFLQQGWNVSATMRLPEKTDVWMNTEKVICPRLDVTNPQTIDAAISETLEYFGRIDVLVNNAGYALMGPLEAVTAEQLNRQFQTNVFGLIYAIQAILPVFRRQGGGTIINVASIGGRLAFPLASCYHSTKWAVEGLSESLRYELEPDKIRIKIIEPGGIKTNFIHRGTVWANHASYTDAIDKVKNFSAKINDSLPEPLGVAKAIYRAAKDRSGRLRYSPHGKSFLFLHKILPDRVWRSLIARVMLGKDR